MSIASVDDSNGSTSTLMSLIFHDLLVTVTSLKYVSFRTQSGWKEAMTISSSSLMQTTAIECLIVKGIQINLHQIFAIAPMLRQLNVELSVSQFSDVGMIFQPPINLEHLSITTIRMTMLEIKCLLSPMTRLTHLTLNIDDVESDMINGHAWIPLLTRIIIFQFAFSISNKNDVDLDSFRTRFWLEEKKWYVTFDQWTNTSSSFLYTNPCLKDYFYPLPYMKKTLVTESTGLEPTTFPHTKYLFFNTELPMSETHLRRFTHANTLIIEKDLNISLEYIVRYSNLSRITSFIQGESEIAQSSTEFVRILHSLPHLCSLCLHISTLILLFDRHWPQIIDLNMKSDSRGPCKRLSSNEIDALWRSFSYLERLDFDRRGVRNLSKLFNNVTMSLSNVSIRHYGDIDDLNPRMVTRQWLEQKTKLCHFDYFQDSERKVHLWL
ncbi:unnamed protein product [Rotaria sp. Silwood2]|nr:unnamed protein product [Rotaria sp. Silwood2]